MVSACTLQHHLQIHMCSLLTCKKHQFAPTMTFLNLSNTFQMVIKLKKEKSIMHTCSMHYTRMNCSPVIVMLVDWLLPCSFLLAEDDQVWSHSMNVAEIQNTYRQLLNNEEKIHIIFSLEPYEKPLTFNNWCFIFTFQSKYISLYC